jgi:hypothetical protein
LAAVLGEYQSGPDGAKAKEAKGATGASAAEGRERDAAGGMDGREYGWDAADVRAMQRQYQEFCRASKASKWWDKK